MQGVLNSTDVKEIDFVATKDDFVKAALLASSLISRLLWIYVIFLAVTIGLSVLRNGQNLVTTIGAFGQFTTSFLIFLALYRIFVIPQGARRAFLKSPLAHESQSLTILPDQIFIRSHRGEVRFLWKDFVAWKTNKYVTLLYTNPRIYLVIPSQLAEQGADIGLMHSGLTAALGPAKR